MRSFAGIVVIVSLAMVSACSMFGAGSEVSTNEDRWRAFATSIPAVELPSGMSSQAMKSTYRVPAVSKQTPKVSVYQGVVMPPGLTQPTKEMSHAAH